MTHTIRAFDFGGSGVKTAVYAVTSSGATLASKIERFEAPDYPRFSRWLAERVDVRGPVLAIAIGTSIGIAVSDEAGCIVRVRRDRPLECGQIRLRTSASNDEAWWALGTAGLEEQQAKKGRADGAKQFGYRVGAFAAQYAALFHARTVVLSGGLIAFNWEDMREATEAEFAHNVPGWMSDKPTLLASEWGREAALVGAARYAHSRMVPRV